MKEKKFKMMGGEKLGKGGLNQGGEGPKRVQCESGRHALFRGEEEMEGRGGAVGSSGRRRQRNSKNRGVVWLIRGDPTA